MKRYRLFLLLTVIFILILTGCECIHRRLSDASCVSAAICESCGAEVGEATPNNHQWREASYSSPKTCAECDKTEGEAISTPDGCYEKTCIPDFGKWANFKPTESSEGTTVLFYKVTDFSIAETFVASYCGLLEAKGFEEKEKSENDLYTTFTYSKKEYGEEYKVSFGVATVNERPYVYVGY